MFKSRLEKLRAAFETAGLDAVVLNPGPTLTYLTGIRFHLMERPVVLMLASAAEPALVLPELEMAKVEEIPYAVTAFPYGEDPAGWDEVFRRAAQRLGLDGKRIGVEPRQMRLLEFWRVRVGAPEADYLDASLTLGSLRLRKDPAEVEAMRSAVRIAQSALQDVLPKIKIGMSEKELAAELVMQLLQNGSEPEFPFAPIVSSGPNSANPHASPTDRSVQAGDLLLFDWGATADGYISDLTRTFAVGQVEPELMKIHKIVQEANAAGRAAAKPGATCASVDAAARAVIERAGYGQYFTHRTGHGIGMEAHEDPYIRGDNVQVLEAGMAFTVEPGIYLPGRNGVRIEDNIVISRDGADVLSDMSRDLAVVG